MELQRETREYQLRNATFKFCQPLGVWEVHEAISYTYIFEPKTTQPILQVHPADLDN